MQSVPRCRGAAASALMLAAALMGQGCRSQPLAVGGPYLRGEVLARRTTALPLDTPIEVVIRLYSSDAAHTPLVGCAVTLAAAQATIVQPSAPTDANGTSYATVQAHGEGEVIVRAQALPADLAPVALPPLTLAFVADSGATLVVTSPVGLSVGRAVAAGAGDVNRDGVADLVVLDATLPALYVWHGGRSFPGTAQVVSLGSAPQAIVVADLNGDGFADVAVARQGATELSSTLEIFAASHSGLDSSATFALAGMAHAMAAVDLDAALPVDLVVAEPHEQTSALELFTFAASSTGLQTRLAPMTVAVAGQSTALAAGAINASDANGDVAIAAGESVLLYPGSDAGLGAVAATLAVTGSPTAIAIGDVNGDGAAEVVVVTATATAAAATAGSGELVVFQASGDGFSFSRLPALALTGTPTAVAIGDVTGDGLPDVAVLTKGNSTGTGRLEVFVQAADGSLHAAEPQPVADDPVAVVIADFNADTRPDIAVVSYGQPVMVFYGQ